MAREQRQYQAIIVERCGVALPDGPQQLYALSPNAVLGIARLRTGITSLDCRVRLAWDVGSLPVAVQVAETRDLHPRRRRHECMRSLSVN